MKILKVYVENENIWKSWNENNVSKKTTIKIFYLHHFKCRTFSFCLNLANLSIEFEIAQFDRVTQFFGLEKSIITGQFCFSVNRKIFVRKMSHLY